MSWSLAQSDIPRLGSPATVSKTRTGCSAHPNSDWKWPCQHTFKGDVRLRAFWSGLSEVLFQRCFTLRHSVPRISLVPSSLRPKLGASPGASGAAFSTDPRPEERT